MGDDMQPDHVRRFEYEELVGFTDNFSESNYIGRFQFGKIYRAVLGKTCPTKLLVKIWEVPEIYSFKPVDNKIRLMEEVILLRHEVVIKHPCMVKMYGYCFDDEHLGAVYLLNPFDSIFNLISKDSYTWLQRIKAVFGLASVLKFLHAKYPTSYFTPFVVQNLDPAHIVIEEDYNPRLCDFGLMCGGILPNRRSYSGPLGCYGYIDVSASSQDDCSNKKDVFAFGVILLSLISKRVYTEEDRQSGLPTVYEWALGQCQAFESYSEMRDAKFSLVHKSMASESEFCGEDGHKITMIALECVNGVQSERPAMKQVFRALRKLEVVKDNAEFIGANNKMLLRPWEITKKSC
ncbi:PREDICTED: probable receptor-like protein kinase At5g56460 [Erythranthe guttata]|nr:PREDICTED: probable receptor-like protein kinase At5g56460 [Erythranthe guttata]|eukprot:XP_012830658.1 PREDICTED: probable receptor-like protein kinase At5g56460 [Erythranthe guttata]